MSIFTRIRAVILFCFTSIFNAAVVIFFFEEHLKDKTLLWGNIFGLFMSLMITLFIYRLYRTYHIKGDWLSSGASVIVIVAGIIGVLVVIITGLESAIVYIAAGIGQLIGVVVGVFLELQYQEPTISDTSPLFSLKNPALQNALTLILMILGGFGLFIGLVAWQFPVPVEPVNQQVPPALLVLSHSSPVQYVAVSPGGKLLASASNKEVLLWPLGQCLQTPAQCQSQPFNLTVNILLIGLAFSPDEQRILVGSVLGDPQIQIYPLETCQNQVLPCEPVYTFAVKELITAIAFSPTGDTVALGNRFNHTIELRQIADCHRIPKNETCGKLRRTLKVEGDLGLMTFAPDGDTLASIDDQTVRLWQVEDDSLRHRLEVEGANTALLTHPAFAANRAVMAIGGCGSLIGKHCVDPKIWVWRTDNGQLLRVVEPENPAISLAFTSSGDVLGGGLLNGQIAVWDMKDAAGNLLTMLNGHQDRVTDLQFLPNSVTLVSGSADQTVRLWSLE